MCVGRSDFSDPVCKCNRCCCCCHCSCILGSGCELFIGDGASAVGKGQGRKIRKSWTEGFSGGRNRRGMKWTERVFLGRENSGWIEGRLQPSGVLIKYAAPSANARRGYRKMGEWYPYGIYFTPQTLMQKALRRILSSIRYNAKVWMQIKYRIYCI